MIEAIDVLVADNQQIVPDESCHGRGFWLTSGWQVAPPVATTPSAHNNTLLNVY
jgi:hypothetical protein